MDLDTAYANTRFIPAGESYPARWAEAAARFRGGARCELDLPYGEGLREVLDLFHPPRLARGVVVFVHGGYWMAFDKSVWSHLAAGPLAQGWAVAIPSYSLCPEIRISGITAQIARAVAFAAERVPGPVRLTGHSAGGHLVARMACRDVALGCADRVERVVPISPLGDLAPLRETAMNETLGIDAEEAAAESPVHCAPRGSDVRIWVGAEERPVFLDQARGLSEAWDAPLTVAPGRHHFDVIEGLSDPRSELCEAVCGEG